MQLKTAHQKKRMHINAFYICMLFSCCVSTCGNVCSLAVRFSAWACERQINMPDVLMIVAMATSLSSKQKMSRVRAEGEERERESEWRGGVLVNLVARTEFIFHEAAAVTGEAQGYNQTSFDSRSPDLYWLWQASWINPRFSVVFRDFFFPWLFVLIWVYVRVCLSVACLVCALNICLCSTLMFLQVLYDLREA